MNLLERRRLLAVKNFAAAHGVDALKKISTAAIGSITACTLETFGAAADVVAEEFTINGLVEAIEKFYEH